MRVHEWQGIKTLSLAKFSALTILILIGILAIFPSLAWSCRQCLAWSSAR